MPSTNRICLQYARVLLIPATPTLILHMRYDSLRSVVQECRPLISFSRQGLWCGFLNCGQASRLESSAKRHHQLQYIPVRRVIPRFSYVHVLMWARSATPPTIFNSSSVQSLNSFTPNITLDSLACAISTSASLSANALNRRSASSSLV